MSIRRTTFRISQESLMGVEGFQLTLLALQTILPFCLIDCVQLNRTKFHINTARYPQNIWHQLLSDKEWHPKLMFHLVNSLAEEDANRRQDLKAQFHQMLAMPDTKVTIYGTFLYESDSTPEMLRGRGLPLARTFGCELTVDAYTEHVKQHQRSQTQDLEPVAALQRELYRELGLASTPP